MPELPEVEVIRRGLTPHLVGRKILAVVNAGRKLRLPVPKARLQELVVNGSITELSRRAKYLLIHMANGAVLVIHLGMTGRLRIFPANTPLVRHDHLRFRLDNDQELRYNDTRRFGAILVFGSQQAMAQELFAALGPEPFDQEFSADYLLDMARARKQPVKNFLMASRTVVGIGNIYASEILFAARVSPIKPAVKITKKSWQNLVAATRKILAAAIESGGTTIADYVDGNGRPGYFQLQLQVYGRGGEPCRLCQGRITKIKQAGRATYYCPRCQR